MLYWPLKNPAFETSPSAAPEWIESAVLSRLPWLVHAFSTRSAGDFRTLSGAFNPVDAAAHSPAEREEVRLRVLKHFDAEHFALASLRQIHSANIYRVTRSNSDDLRYTPAGFTIDDCRLTTESRKSKILNRPSSDPPAGDAVITDSPGILLSIRTADCMPVLLGDPRRHALAAVHAGWRGALARIAEKTVGEMRRAFKSEPDDLIAVIGPSIRACCYDVGREVTDAFRADFRGSEEFFVAPSVDPREIEESAPGVHLDLVAVARRQLLDAGLNPSKVEVVDSCTACRTDLFFSHRKEGSHAGRMLALIGIRSG